MTTGIVAFAFGSPYSISSNERIGEIVSNYVAFFRGGPPSYEKVFIYIQRDVPILVENGMAVVNAPGKKGNPSPTLRMARGAVRWALKNGLGTLWVVAAKPHIWRCKRDLKYAAREAKIKINILICPEINNSTYEEWFCPESEQSWTRHVRAWMRREFILRLMPMFIYKRIAA